MKKEIKYPYIPEGREIKYVPMDNQYMVMAKNYARENSLDRGMPTCSVIVLDDQVLGIGSNGSDFHEKNECERKKLGSKTGEDYELCEGCHPKNHSEPRAINDSRNKGFDTIGADLYLWGHWWCCKPCWQAIEQAGIKDVYLVEGSEVLFDREKEGNIVGRQFE